VSRRFELHEDVRRARRERLVRKIEEEHRAQCPFRPQINPPLYPPKRTKAAARPVLDEEEEEEEERERVLEQDERLYEEVCRLDCCVLCLNG
jgi:hypothetical protein